MKNTIIVILLSVASTVCLGADINLGWKPPLLTLIELHDNTLINQDVILWKRPNTNENIKLKLFPRWNDKPISSTNKSYKLVYEKNGKNQIIFKDDWQSSGNGEYLSKVLISPTGKFVILETVNLSTGGSSGSDNRNLRILFLTSNVSKGQFIYEIDWYQEEYNPSDYEYTLSYDNRNIPHIILISGNDKKVFEISPNKEIVKEVQADFIKSTYPSFSCKRASNLIETSICIDSNLSALDRVLTKIYAKKKNKKGVIKSQKIWLKNRKSCEVMPIKIIPDCLSTKYEVRINELLDL